MITYVLALPHCLEEGTDHRTLSRILTDIAYSDNIFLVDFQGSKWKSFIVKNFIEKYTDQKTKKKVIDLLSLVSNRKKILKNPNKIKIENDEDWIMAGKEFSNHKNLGAVFSKNTFYTKCNTEFSNICIDILQVDDDPVVTQRWKELDNKEIRLYQSEIDYIRTLKEVFIHSNKIMIIDAYLNGEETYEPIIRLAAEQLGNRIGIPRASGTIEFHTTYKKNYQLDAEDNELKFRREFNKLKIFLEGLKVENKHIYKVFYWDKKESGTSLHDRYIITDIIGIGSKHSFGTNEYQLTEWNLLRASKLAEYRNDYSLADGLFNLKCDVLTI